MNRFMLLVMISLSFSGCASSGNNIDYDYIKTIEIGKTTEKEIIANLGTPMRELPYNKFGQKLLIFVRAHSWLTTEPPTEASYELNLCTLGGGCAETGARFNTKSEVFHIFINRSGIVERFY